MSMCTVVSEYVYGSVVRMCTVEEMCAEFRIGIGGGM